MTARLCLNMIVRNETAILLKCLDSVTPYIDAWAILDTGSTDSTQQMITHYFAERGIPGILGEVPFVNFEQARNEALKLAGRLDVGYDYLLLLDADMELRVLDPAFRDHLTLNYYTVRQEAGISYWNVRLVRSDTPAEYVGVTHEYLRVDGQQARLDGVWFIDKAIGSNREDKLTRDLKLLQTGLAEQPDNVRYQFYLAETLRFLGNYTDAIKYYSMRAEDKGFAEEAWYASLQEARCHRMLGHYDQFTQIALVAFEERPTRSEPLYDLANHYRQNKQHNTALIYALRGLDIALPTDDILFVEDFVYNAGFQEEISISGYYSPSSKVYDVAYECCRQLSQRTDVSVQTRALACLNLKYYQTDTRKR